MKKALSIVLALIMMLSVVSISAMAKGEIEYDYAMQIGQTRTVSLPGATQYEKFIFIKFVPQGTGNVVIRSESEGKSDPVLEVYDDKMDKCIAKADDNGSDRDFYLEFYCEVGKVYYLAMYNLQESAKSWTIAIDCFHETYKNGSCITCFAQCNHEIADNIVGCCPCGENYVGIDIKDGDSVEMYSDNDYFWFRFEPEVTAAYLLASDNADDESTLKKAADPAVIVVDATGDYILASEDDISADDYNFALPYKFEEGKKYFIGVYDNNNNADNWTFTLNKATSHTVEVEETVTNEDGTTSTVTKIVEHDITFVPETESTCQEAGHSNALYCETCDEYLAGNYDYGVADECKDDDANNKCDWCGKTIVEEEPVECSCNCHKTGITKFFFDIKIFFQKIFGLNRYCPCGETHY